MASKPVYGALICQNNFHEIMRCVESILPVVDEVFVMDGGSTDGTYELLQEYQKTWKLQLFQSPYKDQTSQRNLLLSKIPPQSWVVFLDQDEKLSFYTSLSLRLFLDTGIKEELYTSPKRELPLTVILKLFNLIDDNFHYVKEWSVEACGRVFFLDRNLHYSEGYHGTICYREGEMANSLIGDPDFAMLHYMFNSPLRMKTIYKDIASGKRGYSAKEFSRIGKTIITLPLQYL
jgi:glycosyltransferase involved in cell wall biosynthesis